MFSAMGWNESAHSRGNGGFRRTWERVVARFAIRCRPSLAAFGDA